MCVSFQFSISLSALGNSRGGDIYTTGIGKGPKSQPHSHPRSTLRRVIKFFENFLQCVLVTFTPSASFPCLFLTPNVMTFMYLFMYLFDFRRSLAMSL